MSLNSWYLAITFPDDSSEEVEYSTESSSGSSADGGDCEPANTALIMILMDVDAQIKDIYTNILEQTDEEERTKQFEELTKLKVILLVGKPSFEVYIRVRYTY